MYSFRILVYRFNFLRADSAKALTHRHNARHSDDYAVCHSESCRTPRLCELLSCPVTVHRGGGGVENREYILYGDTTRGWTVNMCRVRTTGERIHLNADGPEVTKKQLYISL